MKKLDKFINYIKINRNLFIFLLVIVIVGIVSGSFFSLIVSTDDKAIVNEYLNDFFTKVGSGKLDYSNSLTNSLVFSISFISIMWLFGISVIGFFLVLFMLFLKSFVLGFSVSSIIINFKLKGILFSFFYVFPHHIINILIYILLSAYALMLSYKFITVIIKKKPLDLKNFMNKYIFILFLAVTIITFTSFYEIYALPHILNFLVNLF